MDGCDIRGKRFLDVRGDDGDALALTVGEDARAADDAGVPLSCLLCPRSCCFPLRPCMTTPLSWVDGTGLLIVVSSPLGSGDGLLMLDALDGVGFGTVFAVYKTMKQA